MSDDIILHQYATSPFSEKVRVVLGIKGLAWRAVEIPSIMPKPDLMPMTGGYRKTPVMQIGADIYCDSQLIVRELEKRFPKPTLFPSGDKGLGQALALWTDRPFFQATVPIIFGAIGPLVPQEFIKDREKMFPERPFSTEQMKAAAPMLKDQWWAHAHWLADQLSDGRDYLTGPAPALADANAFHIVWFLNNALKETAEALLAGYPKVRAWFDRVRKIGHGKRTDMTSKEALAIAKATTPKTQPFVDEHDPNQRRLGSRVSVMADDYGRDPIVGELIVSSAEEVAIRRTDPEAGEVVVHFPRVGFLVMPA